MLLLVPEPEGAWIGAAALDPQTRQALIQAFGQEFQDFIAPCKLPPAARAISRRRKLVPPSS
jgi:hypothetical protein